MTKAELLGRADAVIRKGRDTLTTAQPLQGPDVPRGYDPNPENSRRGRFRYRHKRLRMVESRCHTFFLHHGGVCVDH